MKFHLKQSEQVTGFLDKGTNMTGELEFAGTLRIDGNFQGSITTADDLIIGEHAIVHADIKAGEVEIHGQVFGRIEATKSVQIFAGARLHGDIHTPVLAVNAGALLDGGIRMADNVAEEKMVAPDMSHD